MCKVTVQCELRYITITMSLSLLGIDFTPISISRSLISDSIEYEQRVHHIEDFNRLKWSTIGYELPESDPIYRGVFYCSALKMTKHKGKVKLPKLFRQESSIVQERTKCQNCPSYFLGEGQFGRVLVLKHFSPTF